MNINTDLQTGDLILFNGEETGWLKYFTEMIKFATHSNYSHIGMIVKDPTFIHPSLTGTYVWESGWEGMKDPQDGKIKLGVQLTPLHEMLTTFKGSKIMIRKIITKNDCFNNSIISGSAFGYLKVIIGSISSPVSLSLPTCCLIMSATSDLFL